jgi:hypothetical protein
MTVQIATQHVGFATSRSFSIYQQAKRVPADHEARHTGVTTVFAKHIHQETCSRRSILVVHVTSEE